MATATQSRESAILAQRFRELVDEWKLGRGVTSSSREMSRHSAYQAIIELGHPAIPLILAEMQREPDHWFIALRTMTQTDPVAAEHRGDLLAMTADWTAWAKANGIRW